MAGAWPTLLMMGGLRLLLRPGVGTLKGIELPAPSTERPTEISGVCAPKVRSVNDQLVGETDQRQIFTAG